MYHQKTKGYCHVHCQTPIGTFIKDSYLLFCHLSTVEKVIYIKWTHGSKRMERFRGVAISLREGEGNCPEGDWMFCLLCMYVFECCVCVCVCVCEGV